MVRISCPHCGFSKEMDEGRIPAHVTSVNCPACKKKFSFERGISKDAPVSPVAPAVAPAPPAAAATGTILINCNKCGFSREVPKERVPAGSTITCPQCGNVFVVGQAPTPPVAAPSPTMAPSGITLATPPPRPPQNNGYGAPPPASGGGFNGNSPGSHRPPPPSGMPDIGDLFARSWELYKRRVLTLFAIPIIIFVPLIAVVYYLIRNMIPGSSPSSTAMMGFVVFALVMSGFMWFYGAAISAIADESLSIGEVLGSGAKRIFSLGWIFLVTGFIVLGGYMLFFIPGLIFGLWFTFAPFILFHDDERGMNALLKSKEYVKGHFWEVFLRILIISIAPNVLGIIPILGAIVILLFGPFMFIFIYLTYDDLRKMKGDMAFSASIGDKAKWLALGALGYIVIPAIIFALMGSYLMANMSGIISRLQHGRPPMSMSQQYSEPPLQSESAPAQNAATVGTSDYDSLLLSQRIDFDSGTRVSIGPAAFLLDHFWEGEKPHVWLKVRIIPLPNLELDTQKFARVSIAHVWNKSNADIYDGSSDFEKEFFQKMALNKKDNPSPHFEGIRDVRLKGGAKESDIDRIEGTLILTLPEGVEEKTFDKGMVDTEQTVSGGKITLKGIATGSVTFDYVGDYENILRLSAFDSQGKQLQSQGSSWSNDGGVTHASHAFNGEVASVKIVAASAMSQREYKFEIKK